MSTLIRRIVPSLVLSSVLACHAGCSKVKEAAPPALLAEKTYCGPCGRTKMSEAFCPGLSNQALQSRARIFEEWRNALGNLNERLFGQREPQKPR